MNKRSWDEYIEALTIFKKYAPDATCVLEGEHESVYAILTDIHKDVEIDEKDVQRLTELGWSIDEETEWWRIFT